MVHSKPQELSFPCLNSELLGKCLLWGFLRYTYFWYYCACFQYIFSLRYLMCFPLMKKKTVLAVAACFEKLVICNFLSDSQLSRAFPLCQSIERFYSLDNTVWVTCLACVCGMGFRPDKLVKSVDLCGIGSRNTTRLSNHVKHKRAGELLARQSWDLWMGELDCALTRIVFGKWKL